MKTFYHHGLLYISVKSVFQTNLAIRWKILSYKLYASIVQFSCVQWNFKRPFFNQSRFVRSNLFPSTYNFVFVLFYFLIWQIIDARKYDNKGTACTLYSLHSQNGPAHLLPGNKHDDGRRKNWPSPPVIIFCTISEFPYMLIRFLLHSSLVKSDNKNWFNQEKNQPVHIIGLLRKIGT